MTERHDEIRKCLIRVIGKIDAVQILFERHAATGTEDGGFELRADEIEWALRENGQHIRKAAMKLVIEIEV